MPECSQHKWPLEIPSWPTFCDKLFKNIYFLKKNILQVTDKNKVGSKTKWKKKYMCLNYHHPGVCIWNKGISNAEEEKIIKKGIFSLYQCFRQETRTGNPWKRVKRAGNSDLSFSYQSIKISVRRISDCEKNLT